MSRVPSAFDVLPGRYYVYVIGYATGPQKVGCSGDPARRAWTLKKARQRHFSIHHQIEVPIADVRAVEALAHHFLARATLGGEWFDVTPQEAAGAVDDAVRRYAAGERAPRPADPMTVALTALFTEEMLLRVNDFRGSFRRPPNRSEAIRILVGEALDARERKPKDKPDAG